MDRNLAGHVIEASSRTWKSTLGSIHKDGHDVFGTNLMTENGDSFHACLETFLFVT